MLCNLITLIAFLSRTFRHPLVDDHSHRGVKGDGSKVPQRRRRRISWCLLETVLWHTGVRRFHLRGEGKYLSFDRSIIGRTLSMTHRETVKHGVFAKTKSRLIWGRWSHREQNLFSLRFLLSKRIRCEREKIHNWALIMWGNLSPATTFALDGNS